MEEIVILDSTRLSLIHQSDQKTAKGTNYTKISDTSKAVDSFGNKIREDTRNISIYNFIHCILSNR